MSRLVGRGWSDLTVRVTLEHEPEGGEGEKRVH